MHERLYSGSIATKAHAENNVMLKEPHKLLLLYEISILTFGEMRDPCQPGHSMVGQRNEADALDLVGTPGLQLRMKVLQKKCQHFFRFVDFLLRYIKKRIKENSKQ